MKKILLTLSLFALPILANAQQLDKIKTLVESIGRIVGVATPIVVGIALIAFFWGLAKFIFSAGDETKRDSGKSIMIWGIVALFVMVSVWGIVQFIGEAVGVDQVETQVVPEVPGLPQP